MASPPRKRAKTNVPPPPSIGAGLPKPKGVAKASPATGDGADEAGSADAEPAPAPTDDSETSRWPSLNEPLAHDDDDDDPFSAPLAPPPSTPAPVSRPPEIEPSESTTGLKAPSASESSGAMRAISIDGWDMPDVPSPGDVAMPSLPPKKSSAPPPPLPTMDTPAASAARTPEPLTGNATTSTADGATAGDEPPILGETDLTKIPIPEPSVPRLPMPGMLRDGAEPKAADFRTRSKGRPSSPLVAGAMPPPKGVVPPKRGDGEPVRIKPGDTASLVANVAVELMAESMTGAATPADASLASASLVDLSIEPEKEDRKAAAVVAGAAVAPATSVNPPKAPPADEPRRRPVVLALFGGIAAAVLGLVIWASFSGDDEPVETAASPASEDQRADGSTPAEIAPEPDDGNEPIAAALPPDLPPIAGDDETMGSTGTGGSTGGGSTGGGSSSSDDGGSSSSGDSTDDEEPEVVASSSSPRPKPKPKPKPKPSTQPKPTPSTQPKPKPKANDSADPTELLSQARAAYRKGQGSRAYTLATKSNRLRPSEAAAELRTLAACLMKDENKARSALKGVPLLQRGKVRGTCKSKHGVRIPL